jgi:hypothetical protein
MAPPAPAVYDSPAMPDLLAARPQMLRGSAAAPRITLVLVLWALAAGAMVLFPSLVYLFRVFKRQPA